MWAPGGAYLTVVASTASPTRNRRNERTMVSKSDKKCWCETHVISTSILCDCLCVVGTKSNAWHVCLWLCFSLTWWHAWSYIVSSASWMDGLGGWCGSDVWQVTSSMITMLEPFVPGLCYMMSNVQVLCFILFWEWEVCSFHDCWEMSSGLVFWFVFGCCNFIILLFAQEQHNSMLPDWCLTVSHTCCFKLLLD